MIFVAFVEEFNTVFSKSCIVFCAKPKKVDSTRYIPLIQISVSIALKYIINNNVWKKKQKQGIGDCNTFFYH